ncbi:MAG: putrescine-binding periplasmic protein [Lysobacteraceae bacterium]|nr:MAG: putrescine-binding periplasmic protein [Xanthomonadaceae bacterium]
MRMFRFPLVVPILLSLAACGGQKAPEQAQGEASPPSPAPAARVVNFYNWSDYIGEDTLERFTAETGIQVTYDVFDSNETLEAKLVAGHSGYDLVVPSLSFLGRQIKAGVFQPIDRSRLSHYGNLDSALMERIAKVDPGNTYAVPYLWGTTGIGYNVEKLRQVLGDDFVVDSWKLIFDPAIMSKLAACGVAWLDTPTELVPIALNYLGEDPNSFDEAVIEKAATLMQGVREHVRYFHSSQYINDLANGDICVAVGWSGDVFQARDRAEEAGNGVVIDYVIPKEGGVLWFDMLAIPKDAEHVAEAHALIDYLLRPEVMAGIQNYVTYASPNLAALPLVDEEIRNNPAVYPPEEVKQRLFTLAVLPPDVDRVYTRLWTRLKTGH